MRGLEKWLTFAALSVLMTGCGGGGGGIEAGMPADAASATQAPAMPTSTQDLSQIQSQGGGSNSLGMPTSPAPKMP